MRLVGEGDGEEGNLLVRVHAHVASVGEAGGVGHEGSWPRIVSPREGLDELPQHGPPLGGMALNALHTTVRGSLPLRHERGHVVAVAAEGGAPGRHVNEQPARGPQERQPAAEHVEETFSLAGHGLTSPVSAFFSAGSAILPARTHSSYSSGCSSRNSSTVIFPCHQVRLPGNLCGLKCTL